MQRLTRKITSTKDFGKVAVLYGGMSAERDVSLMSGKAVHAGLEKQLVDAHLIDLQHQDLQILAEQQFDRVFIALHGRGGEDGTLQGALEHLNIPYTGSGVLGSALSLDKLRCKQVFKACGLPTPRWAVVNAATDSQTLIDAVGLPMVIKPSNEGSSIGMSIVMQADELPRAIEAALQLDANVIAEQFIDGKELTVSILHDRTLPIIHIETPRTFYDYEAKYFSDNTRYHCPAALPEELAQNIAAMSLAAFKAVDAYGWGRVDLMLDQKQNAWLLEVNTVPGMTSHSLVPMAAKAVGISFADLVWQILETAFIQEQC
ncbi:MAG: D-alanine--D-alanine ligase [Gammaproteobacteria bacterium]|nr:D-alanine--D-alanine ligase [Gammaproteobacteria bacterium]NNC97333.1 D-alanine--D-alanine ligase [Gammaproteobacteria bacterium]NNM14925.1 D-alanine--D-alanine ligase [Gammaproteobacteria bacterium]